MPVCTCGAQDLPQPPKIIVPAHIAPLADRIEEYVTVDGKPPTVARANAHLTTVKEIVTALANLNSKSPFADAILYFVGTCYHEAGCTNEWDTEKNGFVSVGAFQISEEEAISCGFSLLDMLDLQKSMSAIAQLAERHLKIIIDIDNSRLGARDYVDENGKTWIDGNLRAYLALAHNQGLGAAVTSIHAHGMDWAGYKRRNPTLRIVSSGYGDDVITGGAQWRRFLTDVMNATRIVM